MIISEITFGRYLIYGDHSFYIKGITRLEFYGRNLMRFPLYEREFRRGEREEQEEEQIRCFVNRSAGSQRDAAGYVHRDTGGASAIYAISDGSFLRRGRYVEPSDFMRAPGRVNGARDEPNAVVM